VKYLLDTDICIFIIRRRPESVFKKLREQPTGAVAISAITQSELYNGVFKSSNPEKNLAALEEFLLPLAVLAYEGHAGLFYGRLRSHLERVGQPIGPLDTLIAAHALSLDLVLVTNNRAEFDRVPDLRVENWL